MNQTYNLNLIPGKVPVTCHVKQYDTGLRNLVFKLYAGDSTFTIPSNTTITVSGTKPDGNGFSYNVTNFSGNTVTVPMREQMTPLAGEFPCQLTIANGGNIIGTASFILAVEAAALSDDVPVSETDLALFQELATQTQEEAATVAGSAAQITANTQAISQLNSNFAIVEKTIVRVNNSYFNAEDVGRCKAYVKAGWLYIYLNLRASTAASSALSDFIEIATIQNVKPYWTAMEGITAQYAASKPLEVMVTGQSGTAHTSIQVYASAGFNQGDFYRATIAVPIS